MNKIVSVHGYIKYSSLSILGISETHLLSSIPNSYIDVPDYILVCNGTASSNAKHGVLCYVHHSLKPNKLTYPRDNCLSFEFPANDITDIVAYRPPSNSSESNQALIDAVVSLSASRAIILIWDLNLPSLKWNLLPLCAHYILPTDQLFLDCFDSLGLIQWVQEPTYPRSCNVLDLFFTSDPDRVGQTSVLPPLPKCDHCPIVVDYLFQSNHTVATQTKPYPLNERTPRHWERGRYNIMNRELSLTNWDFEFAHKDANACYQRFCDILYSLIT